MGNTRVDLNADVGEGMPAEHERALLRLMSSANIACGGHAGDIATMRRTLEIARELGLRVGAHPSYPDRANFGRVTMAIGHQALVDSVGEQIASLQEAALQAGNSVAYFKPHGALYNDAAVNDRVAAAVFEVARLVGLPVMMLAGAPAPARVRDGIDTLHEGFLDRGYRPDGTLIPRHEPGALLTSPEEAVAQALRLAASVDSLCVHSDSPAAVNLARRVREALEEAGYEVAP
ncbi:MAG TPA: LamB/YcsF family protein [Actinomycetota bacterium]|nr:LamB/YcsF family protein [Actinomycetota bacterium]